MIERMNGVGEERGCWRALELRILGGGDNGRWCLFPSHQFLSFFFFQKFLFSIFLSNRNKFLHFFWWEIEKINCKGLVYGKLRIHGEKSMHVYLAPMASTS